MMIRANYHTHTVLCDGNDTPEDVAGYAASKGFTHLGFSGHMDADIHMDIRAYYSRIRSLKEKYSGRMDILTGIELDTLYDRSCAYDAEYIIGSTHFLDVPSAEPMSVDSDPQKLKELCDEFFGGDYYKLSKAYYELEAETYDRTGCTVVGHFDLITRFNDSLRYLDESDARYRTPALEAMEHLVSKDVIFEINCGAVNRGRKKELYPAPFLLRALSDMGGQVMINSDAHSKELLSKGFLQAARCAKMSGFKYTNILEHAADGSVAVRQVPLDEFVG